MVLSHFASIAAGTWIISPHPDDAALSLALAILAGTLPKPINIVSVFTVSAFSSLPSCDRDIVTAIRAREDSLFAVWSDVNLHSLAFVDAPLRDTYSDGRSVFDPNFVVSPLLRSEVAQAVLALNDFWDSSLLVLPRGIGHHIDHRTVAEIGQFIDAKQTVYYSDQPYAFEYAAYPEGKRALIWSAVASPHNVLSKRCAISHYESQPAVARFLQHLDKVAEETPIEFLWSR